MDYFCYRTIAEHQQRSNHQRLQATMPANKPLYLRICLILCNVLSCFLAGIQYCMIAFGFLRKPVYILKTTGTLFKNLYNIWYARVVRRMLSALLRTPLRKSSLGLINFSIPVPVDSGCVIVICHSPWKRILTQWCLENKFALIIGGGKWSHRKKLIQRKGAGITELRNLIRHLQQKGRVILAADVFNSLNNCPVNFLGNKYNASIVHIRLAILAKVPLIVVVPKLKKTSLDFILGPQLRFSNLKSGYYKATRHILSFFEKEIEKDPTIWSSYVK
jgi:hypothetical protein